MAKDPNWWFFTVPAFAGANALCDGALVMALVVAFLSIGILSWAFAAGGVAWKNGRNRRGRVPIPGPRGLPFLGSLLTLRCGLAHRRLSEMAVAFSATKLMAFSLGSTPAVVASDPATAKEILTSPYFADRPIKQSARELLFTRAMGFAPSGAYWRLLRRIAASHLFAPRRIRAHEAGRLADCSAMLAGVRAEQAAAGLVGLRKHLLTAGLNNVMGSVFGFRGASPELKEMVREGFELLGAFNWSDFLPWLSVLYDPYRVRERCAALVPRVRSLVKEIIDDHRERMKRDSQDGVAGVGDDADFVDVLLSLEGEEKLGEDDMIAVLWEMIFRGSDTTALLTEWAMAELVLNRGVQRRLQEEIDGVVGKDRPVTDADVCALPYLQAVVKETLRLHPPGPLLSWARLSTADVEFANGMVVPAGTTAMVNMWHISHDPAVWAEPLLFRPERFLEADVDVRGSDLRLAPFGAGRRACPGKGLGLATVSLWVAALVQSFSWLPSEARPVSLGEVLKLSCEMEEPLHAIAVPRRDLD